MLYGKKYMSLYYKEHNMNPVMVWVDIVSLMLIVVGALNWGLVAWFNFNAVEWLANHTFSSLAGIVYTLVAVAALMHLFSRDYYLRFLGQCAFPCGALVERKPEGANTQVAVRVAPNANVIYWAAEPGDNTEVSPWIAYKQYGNSGVARSDANGNAVLHVRTPSGYTVGMGRDIKPHVHYRVCTSSGMTGRVETASLQH